MKTSLFAYFEAYLYSLIHPYRTHDYYMHQIPVWDGSAPAPKLNFPEALTMSWGFWIVGGLVQMFLINGMLHLLLSYQNSDNIFFALINFTDALFPYYLFIFSLLLDLIFFPILTLIQVEFMNAIIRFYGKILGLSSEDAYTRADQISTVAMSSHFFSFIPILGKVLVHLSYLSLVYVGLRHNLGATRSLSLVILLTPIFFFFVAGSLLFLCIFYLIML